MRRRGEPGLRPSQSGDWRSQERQIARVATTRSTHGQARCGGQREQAPALHGGAGSPEADSKITPSKRRTKSQGANREIGVPRALLLREFGGGKPGGDVGDYLFIYVTGLFIFLGERGAGARNEEVI